MAQIVKDSFLDLERHRQLLEENIEKLRKSLRHWQTWEAEYEGLKEEILGRSPPPNQEQLIELARNYEGELVNQKEINEILEGPPRPSAQIVNLLDRRIDYAEQNVRTIEKQIELAENKLAAATIISKPDVRNEEGLPLTDIVEELDEEGNIISSRISTPGSAKPQLLEVLEKAGIQNLPESANLSQNVQLPPEDKLEGSPAEIKPAKKGVKFSADTKIGPEPEKSQTAKRVEAIIDMARQQDTGPSEPPIIPTDESPEDAALRREMLQYGMSEVGSVVAELDLEEGSDWTDGEHDDYEEDESSTDDEDEFGRSTGRVVDDELRQQMMELEERLGVRMMENAGPKPDDYDIVKEGIGRISINGDDENAVKKAALKESTPGDSTDVLSTQASKKSVRFSEEIDVSPPPKPPSNLPQKTTAPVSDIVERTAPAQVDPPKPKKTSRFKLDRAGGNTVSHANKPHLSAGNPISALSLQPAKSSTPKPFSTPIQYQPQERTRVTPTGPQGKTLASAVIERDVPLNTSATAPDELDPDLLHQEVAAEYHKMRNKMIQREGGFMKEDESEIVPRTEEEGGPKKMSRFKAVRLAKS